jgi:hypothetical protein
MLNTPMVTISFRFFSKMTLTTIRGSRENHHPAMRGQGKSDSPMLPTKPPNKTGLPVAEVVEGRGLTTSRTQQPDQDVPSALERVRQAAIRNEKERFKRASAPRDAPGRFESVLIRRLKIAKADL